MIIFRINYWIALADEIMIVYLWRRLSIFLFKYIFPQTRYLCVGFCVCVWVCMFVSFPCLFWIVVFPSHSSAARPMFVLLVDRLRFELDFDVCSCIPWRCDLSVLSRWSCLLALCAIAAAGTRLLSFLQPSYGASTENPHPEGRHCRVRTRSFNRFAARLA